jgi:hypothetical protein
MMKMLYRLLVLVVLLVPVSMQGQGSPTESKPLLADRSGFYEGGQRIDRKVFWQKVRSVPAAAEELARVKRKTTGAVVSGSAGILLVVFSEPVEYVPGVFGQRSELKGGRQILGGGLIVLAGVVALSTDGGRQRAIDAYNSALSAVKVKPLGLPPHGLGLMVYF